MKTTFSCLDRLLLLLLAVGACLAANALPFLLREHQFQANWLGGLDDRLYRHRVLHVTAAVVVVVVVVVVVTRITNNEKKCT